MTPTWLHWARQLKAIAQNGSTYAKNPFELERYQALEELATRPNVLRGPPPILRRMRSVLPGVVRGRRAMGLGLQVAIREPRSISKSRHVGRPGGHGVRPER